MLGLESYLDIPYTWAYHVPSMKTYILTTFYISNDIAVTVVIRSDQYFVSISMLLIQILAMMVLVENIFFY